MNRMLGSASLNSYSFPKAYFNSFEELSKHVTAAASLLYPTSGAAPRYYTFKTCIAKHSSTTQDNAATRNLQKSTTSHQTSTLLTETR
ncbi:uncharacterized protein J3R85_010518 [Psidium guajava]|nr:uncharacterized protein J3R85_010518 [Psidium guajava]